MKSFEKLCEMNAMELISAVLDGTSKDQNMQPQNATAIQSVQPTDNTGSVGMVASKTIDIIEEDDGCLRLKTSEICVGLSKMAVDALKAYFERIK